MPKKSPEEEQNLHSEEAKTDKKIQRNIDDEVSPSDSQESEEVTSEEEKKEEPISESPVTDSQDFIGEPIDKHQTEPMTARKPNTIIMW